MFLIYLARQRLLVLLLLVTVVVIVAMAVASITHCSLYTERLALTFFGLIRY